MRKLLLATSAVVMSLLLAACSSSGGGTSSGGSSTNSNSSSSTTSTGSPTITIDSFAYSGDLTVKVGEKVTVVNKDSVPHTLTDKATMKFDTGDIAPGATGSFTAPSQPGSYPFGCRIHSEMKGTLVVQ
jgi:plastocyanin